MMGTNVCFWVVLIQSALFTAPGRVVESFVVAPAITTAKSASSSILFSAEVAEKVETPNPAVFNFGAASTRDTVLYTAERPGNPETKTALADMDEVQAWIAFMKQQGIGNVIALLDENELANYAEPGLVQIYKDAGIRCLVQPMRGASACSNIIAFVREAEANQEKVVAHCTGGIGRAGRVAACWLMKR